jgi:hypothetical protein
VIRRLLFSKGKATAVSVLQPIHRLAAHQGEGKMVSIGYSSLTFLNLCPHCDSPLFELSDMWGPFYACEDCGYEFSPLVLEPNRAQPQGGPDFAGSLWLHDDSGSQQRLHTACAA